MLRGAAPGRGLDLVGMAIGIVPEGALLDGSAVEPGDHVIGIASNGIHSNGLSLARRALLHRFGIDEHVDELGTQLGEELLRPTRIYVPEVRALRDASVSPRAIAHITGDGLLNLRRVEAAVGFEITDLPEIPALFTLIEKLGEIDRSEMRTVFNMGVGLAVVVAEVDVDRALQAIRATGSDAWPIGRAVADAERSVRIPAEGLVGRSKRFVSEDA
jgi:phosphoribosylformylglycinamidine cyclo-ligase